jgi:Putative DNA-binding domain
LKKLPEKNKPADAKSESKSVDFKSAFDPDRLADWCELLKDVVAMANSGGGTILIGVADNGQCTSGSSGLKILQTDPAMVTDKIAKYTGVQFDAFTIDAVKRRGRKVAMITIGWADPPMIFEKPGTYTLEDGKQQKTAFGAGTFYVRHGAKSEPARSADIARLVDRHVQRARREWLLGVKKVSLAPRGSTVSVLPRGVVQSTDPSATPIRITDDPGAPGYQVIDPDKTHPWRQKELLEQLNKSLSAKINPYDLLAVRRLHHVDDDPNFVHRARFGSNQYSPAFADWLLKQHAADPRFFKKCRSSFNPTGKVHSIHDRRLRWVSGFMKENGLSTPKMARRLKIGASTLSRLLAGKYMGDVPRMLDRVEAYRRGL